MNDWTYVTLDDIALVERGKFSARPRNDPQYYGGNIPFLQTGDVTNSNGVVRTYNQTLNEKGLGVSKLFPAGTLLITIAANIGDVAEVNFDFACPDSLVAVRPKKSVNKYWLKYFLQTQKEYFESRSTQNAQANINLQIIRPLEVLLPPLKIQNQIASILTDTDHAIETTERLIAAKEQYFDGLAKQLLSDAEHWQNSTLESLFHFMKGQALSKEKLSENGQYPCILYGELYTTYDEVITEVKSKTTYNEGISSKADDVLIPASTTTTAYDLAVASVVKQDDVLLGGDINILRKKNQSIDGAFIAYYLTHIKKAEIARYAQGITIIHLYPKDFKHIEIAFPSIEEQYKIVEILNIAKREIDLLKKLAESYRIQKRGLMQKLLSGEWRVAA